MKKFIAASSCQKATPGDKAAVPAFAENERVSRLQSKNAVQRFEPVEKKEEWENTGRNTRPAEEKAEETELVEEVPAGSLPSSQKRSPPAPETPVISAEISRRRLLGPTR